MTIAIHSERPLDLRQKRHRMKVPRDPIPPSRPSTCWDGHLLIWDGDRAVCTEGHRFIWTLNMDCKFALCVAW